MIFQTVPQAQATPADLQVMDCGTFAIAVFKCRESPGHVVVAIVDRKKNRRGKIHLMQEAALKYIAGLRGVLQTPELMAMGSGCDGGWVVFSTERSKPICSVVIGTLDQIKGNTAPHAMLADAERLSFASAIEFILLGRPVSA